MKTENKTSQTTKPAIAVEPVLEAVLDRRNESIITVNRECDCGGCITEYDTFTEEEYCENCGWG